MCCIYGVIICATFIGLMAPGLNAINQGRQAAVDIFDTIERVPKIDATVESVGRKLDLDDEIGCKIELRNLSFSYPSRPDDMIFRDLNLTVEAGRSLAFVGPSGSGKSTVARLLLRFYDPSRGDILIDGVPLPDINYNGGDHG